MLSTSILPVLKFLGKYREFGLLLLRASIGVIFILICGPVLLAGDHRWAQFGSAMRVFNFHAHLDWWGFFGALAGTLAGILMLFGLAFRLGVLLAFVLALVNAVAVAHFARDFQNSVVPVELCLVLLSLALLGPGRYSADKG